MILQNIFFTMCESVRIDRQKLTKKNMSQKTIKRYIINTNMKHAKTTHVSVMTGYNDDIVLIILKLFVDQITHFTEHASLERETKKNATEPK